MAVVNSLAYYDMLTITAVKSFMVKATGACTVKIFAYSLCSDSVVS